MPLRDHFHSPLDDRTLWDGFHGQWPAMIVLALSRKLPPRYVAAPSVHLGAQAEIDIAAFEDDEAAASSYADSGEGGGTATAVWAPPRPTLSVATDVLDVDEYEVRIFDTKRGRRLVATIEIVSPSNKDRPEHRHAFVAKCAALLQNHVSVAIIDLVTTREFNLYGELLESLGQTDPFLQPVPPPLYATECRWTNRDRTWFLETWTHALTLGQLLPTLPLWLADDFAVPLELEPCYEETCRILRIS